MATDSSVKSVTNTLSGTTADAITLTQGWPAMEITNHDSADLLYVRVDGTTAVAQANGCTVILPGQTKVVQSSLNVSPSTGATSCFVSVVGDGGSYTVEGVN